MNIVKSPAFMRSSRLSVVAALPSAPDLLLTVLNYGVLCMFANICWVVLCRYMCCWVQLTSTHADNATEVLWMGKLLDIYLPSRCSISFSLTSKFGPAAVVCVWLMKLQHLHCQYSQLLSYYDYYHNSINAALATIYELTPFNLSQSGNCIRFPIPAFDPGSWQGWYLFSLLLRQQCLQGDY